MFLTFDIKIPACDGRTDGETDERIYFSLHSALHSKLWWCAV